MFLIVGYVIITAAALGTYAVLAALACNGFPSNTSRSSVSRSGGFVAAGDIKIIKSTVAALPGIFRDPKFTGAFMSICWRCSSGVLARCAKEGLMSIENDVEIRTTVPSSASTRRWPTIT